MSSVKNVWKADGTIIKKNDTQVFLSGVCYSPTPIGAATYAPGIGDWFCPPWNKIWERDFPLMQAMGINNIRTYFFWAWEPPKDMKNWKTVVAGTPTFDHKAFLDCAKKNDIDVTIGIALDGGNIFDNTNKSLGEDYLGFYAATAKKLAELYGDHEAVMGFCIGNEQNNPTRIQTSAFWEGLETIASGVKAKAPDKLVMMAMQNDTPGMYTATVPNPPTILGTIPPYAGKSVPECFSEIFDVWGVNIYSGMDTSLASYNTYVASTKYAMPLIVSEWGIPAANTSGELSHKEFDKAITDVMVPRGTAMANNVSFVAGAQYFEWTDEWWKGNGGDTPWKHTLPTNDTWTEEWWGLNSITEGGTPPRPAKNPWDQDKNKPYPPDVITARPTLTALNGIYTSIVKAMK